MTLEEIKIKLASVFVGANIKVEGDGCNCSAIIVSELFADLSMFERQKKVLAVFRDEIKSGDLHALSVKTYTPSER